MSQSPKIEIYTTQVCGYCVLAKNLLDKNGLAYEEIDVTEDASRRDWLVETTGLRTVPQIFIDGQPIGGYDDLVVLDKSGDLDPKVTGA